LHALQRFREHHHRVRVYMTAGGGWAVHAGMQVRTHPAATARTPGVDNTVPPNPTCMHLFRLQATLPYLQKPAAGVFGSVMSQRTFDAN
jgi:hypothetical protein